MLELRKDFADEAMLLCDKAESRLLQTAFSDTFTAEIETLRKDLLGILHTLKGNSGFVMLEQLKTTVHRAEDLLKTVQSFSLDQALKTSLLNLFDFIRVYCNGLSESDVFNEDRAGSLLARLGDDLQHSKTGLISEATGDLSQSSTQYQADFDKVSVKYDDLDLLLNLTGEILVSNRTLVQQLRSSGANQQVDNLIWNTNRRLLALQNKIIEIRSLPFSSLTKKYSRFIFDLASASGHAAELIVVNETALVDRTILERIHEPVMHLIRNIFAHAAEEPDVRLANGKPSALTITLSCTEGSGSNTIEIRDDGRGISTELVKKRALLLGIPVQETAGDREILSLIFKPEFTEKDQADDLSGRGIGLYVVQKTIQEMGGRVEVSSVPGKGTSFRMTIPNIFLLKDVLVFRHNQMIYGLTRDRLEKISSFKPDAVHYVNNRPFLDLDNKLVEILPLFDHDELSAADKYFIKVKSNHSEESGITAEKILGYQEVIVKSIDHLWTGQKNLSGVAQIDSGEMAMIIDTTHYSN